MDGDAITIMVAVPLAVVSVGLALFLGLLIFKMCKTVLENK